MDDPKIESKEDLKLKLRTDLSVLVQYVLDSGKQLEPALVESIAKCATSEDCSFDELLKLHNSLSALIEPSNPTAVRFLMTGRGTKAVNNTPPVVKQTLWATIGLVVLFIAITTSDSLDGAVLGAGLFDRTWQQQLFSALFLVTSAAIGACFYNLSKMYGYIVSRTFDPKYISSYWVRLVLGIIAGYILAEMIPLDMLTSEATIQKPLLALLGGFSADVVDWALHRFVETLKTLIQGSQQHLINQQVEAVKARLELEGESRRLKAVRNIYAQREHLVAAGMIPQDVEKLISKIIDGLQ